MGEIMNFPDTVEEFMEQYKITDTEKIYTNGAELIPIFRMKQWFEHIPAADVRPVVRGEWKKSYADHESFGVRPFFRYCSECHESTVYTYNFCPNCGADMREVE